ncbi:DUF29 family protein [Thiocapsa sp.]|uniref:DUF29 family protein n=1 Tax=Thiocapsa sp. TaxID=2024551 RepID=UPI002C451FC0|nr:DUF29 family protein [Thiocapsa sp.]HSO83760.1 DUF29 family protein [Thiocapsa sp.]
MLDASSPMQLTALRLREHCCSIIEQRKQIQRQIQSSPSVKPYVPEAVEDAYPDAVDIAARETLLSPERFPQTCPYAIDRILDFDFYPNEP